MEYDLQSLSTISQAIRNQREAIAEKIVTRQYRQQPALWEAFDEAGKQKSVRDAGYHLAYLAEAIAAHDTTLFVDYASWVKVLFANLGFPAHALTMTLECTRAVLQETLPGEGADVAGAYIEIALASVQQTPNDIASFIQPDAPLYELARAYLDALLRGARDEASERILNAVAEGVHVRDIYRHVFQTTQHEIGRLWQTNRISVAQEHYCSAATQLIMSQLYPHIFTTERIGRRMVAACVGQELHELGIRMVADFFEIAGWDTYYLGANTPTDSILQALAEREAEVLAISATITTHVSNVVDLIDRVHASEMGAGVRILVGGYPFNVSPTLWRRVAADGYAPDAQQAIEVATALLAEGDGAQ